MMKIREKVNTSNYKKPIRKELLEFVRFIENYRYCKKITQFYNIFVSSIFVKHQIERLLQY